MSDIKKRLKRLEEEEFERSRIHVMVVEQPDRNEEKYIWHGIEYDKAGIDELVKRFRVCTLIINDIPRSTKENTEGSVSNEDGQTETK